MAKYNARAYARLGQAGSIFGMALLDNVEGNNVKVVSADMSVVAGLDRFKRTYPDDFYNVGIAEQNLLGVAAGLSSEGHKTIAVAQACFITMRSFEQARQYMGYMKNNVIMVGINSGFALTFFGNTHYCIEDLTLMRSIPGMTVLSPADAGSAVKAFEAAMKLDKPVYIRLTGSLMTPMVYKEDFEYTIGKSITLKEGKDVTVFATGTVVANVLKAAEMLEKDGVSVKVVDMHTIKPIDKEAIVASKDSKLIFTVEEHNVNGGLGSAVADVMAETGGMPKLIKLGVQDTFSPVGDYNYLIEQHRLTPELIKEDIILNSATL